MRRSRGRCPIPALLVAFTMAWATIVPTEPAAAYVVISVPDGRLGMNLELGDTPFESAGFGVVTWNSVAQAALGRWNQVGVGNPPDMRFFGLRTPVVTVTGDPCRRDGVNEVQWSLTLCGRDWGSYQGVARRYFVGGRVVECDVLFNTAALWDAYPGPHHRAADGRTVFDLRRIALHEFGHCLGLGHPHEHGQTVASIMSYTSHVDDLQADDIAGAHAVNWSSPGGAGLDAFITRFYQNVLGRQPDPGGLANWRAFFQANPTSQGAATFAHGFLESPEFLGQGHSTSSYVTILYRSFMGREPDPAGHANWVSHLDAGRYTRHGVADLFIESAEFQAAWRSLF